MSRSKHTDPARIRAPRRMRAPNEPRGHSDPSSFHALARALKEQGLVLTAAPGPHSSDNPAPLPRLRVSRPRPGCHHPAGRPDILRVLRFIGEPCTYGLESIELVRSDAASARQLLFGRLFVPGRVVLYDQPHSPWLLTGRLSTDDAVQLRAAGALIDADGHGLHTTVTWPGVALRDFMLFDVLMHEIGHHLIQQYKGKRPARVVRTRDHEAFAARFAAHCRALWDEGAVHSLPPAGEGQASTAVALDEPGPPTS